MKRNSTYSWFVLSCLCACSLVTPGWGGDPAAKIPDSSKPVLVREAAVAGLFYPKDSTGLSRALDRFLAAAPTQSIAGLRALICPHAGYEYSGPTAAYGYKAIVGRDIKTVVVMAPSHYAAFRGVAIGKADAYRTPLGLIAVSEKATTLGGQGPFAVDPPCRVERPTWWKQSSLISTPALGEDRPETWEHSLEVQLPFLQKTAEGAKLVPLVFGNVDPQEAARVLMRMLDDQTLLVASSDLSHYQPYEIARKTDERTVRAICNLDAASIQSDDACGRAPIRTLLEIAKQKGWQAQRLDYRNSGDTAGDKRGVVGYAAIAFYAPGEEQFTKSEWKQLLTLARQAVRAAAAGQVPSSSLLKDQSAKLGQVKGCFVTLTKRGELRGCIGHIVPQKPLGEAVLENGVSAAIRDPRFSPVKPKEVDELEIEVSVLTAPKPLEFSSDEDLLRKLRPQKDGVVLQNGHYQATFLPQVWQELPDKVEFLEHLSRKAGCAAGDWRKPGTKVLIYQVEAKKESEL